jgi:hypothetical protein
MARNKKQKGVEPDATGALPGTAATVVQPTIDADGGASHRIAVSEHPRASRFVRKARELAGLGGFLIGGWMSLSTHPLTGALTRALIAGIVCQLVVWAAALLLCRHLIVAEIKSREDALMQAAAARLEAAGRGAGAPIEGRGRAAAAGRARS